MSKENENLAGNPFSYRVTNDSRVRLSFNGQNIMTLKGTQASKFLKKIESKSEYDAQKLMAVTTGNFKRRGVIK